MEEEEVMPQINYIPYTTEVEAQERINAINLSQSWPDGTDNYANVIKREEIFYLPLISNFEEYFTTEEIQRGVEKLPEITIQEIIE